ncbi:hypothetical protein [Owenweeksia hongkongensis]|uniref:hypothetical protein n=1 Tax=Owenweeksia hongkongensis TaxID=253245 RepID=UPI003A937C37
MKGLYIPQPLLEKNLDGDEVMILAKIYQFQKNNRSFYMKNASIGDFINRTERTVASKIRELLKRGLIEKVSFDGRVRKVKLSELLLKEINASLTGKKDNPRHEAVASKYNKGNTKNLNHLYK